MTTAPLAKMTAPKVSVAMCTFNGEAFLRQQIDSILRQTRPVNEIVVADDASTDGTASLLEEYKTQCPGLFKIIIQDKNVGAIANFQLALQECSGDIIFLSDQDDIWLPSKVERMLAHFGQHCLLLFTNGRLIDSIGNPLETSLWQKWDFSPARRFAWKMLPATASLDLLANNKVTGATVAMRRSLLTYALPIRLPAGLWHDQWFAMHAAARNGLRFIPDLLIDYRIHPKQQVGVNKNVPSKNTSEISFTEFYDNFGKQYPSRANIVRKLQRFRRLMNHFR